MASKPVAINCRKGAKYRLAVPIRPPPDQALNLGSLPNTPTVRTLTKYSPRLALDRKYPANKKLLPCPPPKNAVGVDLEGFWIVKAAAKNTTFRVDVCRSRSAWPLSFAPTT